METTFSVADVSGRKIHVNIILKWVSFSGFLRRFLEDVK